MGVSSTTADPAFCGVVATDTTTASPGVSKAFWSGVEFPEVSSSSVPEVSTGESDAGDL